MQSKPTNQKNTALRRANFPKQYRISARNPCSVHYKRISVRQNIRKYTHTHTHLDINNQPCIHTRKHHWRTIKPTWIENKTHQKCTHRDKTINQPLWCLNLYQFQNTATSWTQADATKKKRTFRRDKFAKLTHDSKMPYHLVRTNVIVGRQSRSFFFVERVCSAVAAAAAADHTDVLDMCTLPLLNPT